MHEHLSNLRLGWIAFGWFIAVALMGVALAGLSALDLLRTGSEVEGVWVAIAMAVGFLVAGFHVGNRVNAAPLLTGLGMGLFSLVAWAGLNLVLGEPTDSTTWTAISLRSALSLLVLQIASSMLGTRAGVRWARRAAALRSVPE